MRLWSTSRLLLSMAMFLGLGACDVVAPSLISGPVYESAPVASILNASAVVLQHQGYTVLALDVETGILTTDWQDESSYADQVFLEVSRRSRVSLVLDLGQRRLDIQMTVQKKQGDHPWRNDDLSGRERRRLVEILEAIQSRIGTASAARVVAPM